MAMRATRKCAAGQISPAGQGLRTAALCLAIMKYGPKDWYNHIIIVITDAIRCVRSR